MAIKPRISYVAQLRPLTLDANASVVRKKVDESTMVNWANKTELTDFVDSLYVHPSSNSYVWIKCQCGIEYNYATKTAVPSGNITCACGRRVIKYGI